MNITQYYSEQDHNSPLYRCRATLKQGYTVVDATEPFYRYVGANSARPFPLMVHPDDAEKVKDALERLGEKPQRLIFRLLCEDGNYRYMYGVFEYNGREQDGFRYIDVNMLDIMRIHYRYDSDHVKMVKYRKYMSLSDELYLEYNYATDVLNIFEYVNTRAVMRYKDKLSNLAEQVLASEEYTFKQKAEFESLQEYLKNFAETMELELDGELFGLDCGYIHINGGLVYIENSKEMMVATIKVTGEVKKDDKYYLSPHAFDNATGVYNKRAIKEIAMELIAQAKDNKVLLAVMDIDDFKSINDNFGHMMGDEVIAKVAEIIRTTLSNRGYVGRFGGDEFMVVTEKVKDAEDFSKIIKTVRKNIAWSCGEILSNTLVTLSVGVATCPDHGTGYDELFKIADKCLYIAKCKGKNRIIRYLPAKHVNYDMAADTKDKRMPLTFEQSCKAVMDIMSSNKAGSVKDFEKDLRKFLQCYNIDRVLIGTGEKYTTCCVAVDDKVVNSIPAALENMDFFAAPSADVLFAKNGVLLKNKLDTLQDPFPGIYEGLSSQGTESFVAVKVAVENAPQMIVLFDMAASHRKWSDNDAGVLGIAAWAIARQYLQAVCGNEE